MTPPTPPARDQALDRPVFIVGPLRSGTTLLRLLVGHHPDVHMFGEFEESVSQTRGTSWPTMRDYHAFCKRDRMVQLNHFAVDESLDYPSLMQSFLAQAYDRGGKPIVGASIHSRMDMLPKLWPNALYIHTLRDPRDVAKSCIGMGWVGNVHEGAAYWLRPEKHWDMLKAQVRPEQCLDIKYEDLVRQPEATLTKVCDFLGIAYSEQMLAIDGDTSYERPDARLAEQWKRKQSPREVQWVEYQCAEMMKLRGYALSGHPIRRPSLLELQSIRVNNRLGRFRTNCHRFGTSLWVQHLVAKRSGIAAWRDAVQQRVNQRQNAWVK